MRKITEDAIRAFRYGREFKQGNTWVQCVHGRIFLHLHGNVIAEMTQHGELWICDAGHQTVTTKERLNGFNMVNIVQKNSDWYLNGELWDGSLIKVEW
jgi:hypothetical protein